MTTAAPPEHEALPEPGARQRVTFPVTGMFCAACASRIQRQLAATPGVRDAAVNFATTKATVELDDAPLDAIAAAVREAGYDVGTDALTVAVSELRFAAGVARLEQAVAAVPGVVAAVANHRCHLTRNSPKAAMPPIIRPNSRRMKLSINSGH